MNCPSADKLSQYVDGLLAENERQSIQRHVGSCPICQEIVELFQGEEQFMKETLQEPLLPADFNEQVLVQLQSYKKKKSLRAKWVAVAATILFTLGIMGAMTPSFAQFITSLFATERVDKGLNEAERTGFVEQVDYAVTNQGYTVQVEEVMVDMTRIVFIYKVLNSDGQAESINGGVMGEMVFQLSSGERIDAFVGGGGQRLEEGTAHLVELETPSAIEEDMILQWHIQEIAGVKGKWQLDILLPIEKALAVLKKVEFQDVVYEYGDVRAVFDRIEYSPSATTIRYRTEYVNPSSAIRNLEPAYRDLELAYTIEDEQGDMIASNWTYVDLFEDVTVSGEISANASFSEDRLIWERKESFKPFKVEKPTLVIEGFVRYVPSGDAITFHPKQLQQRPAIDYNGKNITITAMEQREGEWEGAEPFIAIDLAYAIDEIKDEFTHFKLEDAAGNYYDVAYTRDENITLKVEGLDNLDQQFTLHLISARTFEKAEDRLRIPLYE
ncbi:DUF4179 domain-containing protein [Metasolibacillus meyeri]|uniref:DUF4179 domain-containing protein n=1 Tax=Metasolibacillus meyeri TaxID=1071052 RepID=UPI00187D58E0|nr:DUF4179 domain-containing protein [Metasolibacillus meyeri]